MYLNSLLKNIKTTWTQRASHHITNYQTLFSRVKQRKYYSVKKARATRRRGIAWCLDLSTTNPWQPGNAKRSQSSVDTSSIVFHSAVIEACRRWPLHQDLPSWGWIWARNRYVYQTSHFFVLFNFCSVCTVHCAIPPYPIHHIRGVFFNARMRVRKQRERGRRVPPVDDSFYLVGLRWIWPQTVFVFTSKPVKIIILSVSEEGCVSVR